jgi:hypothetical protein
MDVYLMDVYLMACTSLDVYLMDVYLMACTSFLAVYLTGVHLMSVYLLHHS